MLQCGWKYLSRDFFARKPQFEATTNPNCWTTNSLGGQSTNTYFLIPRKPLSYSLAGPYIFWESQIFRSRDASRSHTISEISKITHNFTATRVSFPNNLFFPFSTNYPLWVEEYLLHGYRSLYGGTQDDESSEKTTKPDNAPFSFTRSLLVTSCRALIIGN